MDDRRPPTRMTQSGTNSATPPSRVWTYAVSIAPRGPLGSAWNDGVVDEHGVELSPEPHRLHVTVNVLALGIDPTAQCQHLG